MVREGCAETAAALAADKRAIVRMGSVERGKEERKHGGGDGEEGRGREKQGRRGKGEGGEGKRCARAPTGKVSWISSHFEKRQSDTHRRNICVCRLQGDPPYSGRGGPPVVKDPGKNLDQVALWLAHNAPHFTVSTHMIGSLRPLTLLLIVVDLNGIY